jgi:hypothetical protein
MQRVIQLYDEGWSLLAPATSSMSRQHRPAPEPPLDPERVRERR